jgi:hypothetical protein
MKKLFLPLAAMLLCCTAYAQTTIVPRLGISLATIKTDTEEGMDGMDLDFKSRIGLTVGVGVNIPISQVISFQPELLFIQKGSKEELTASVAEDGVSYDIDATQNVAINYLEVPVLIKATFGTSTKFFVVAGPSFSYGMGGPVKSKFKVTVDFGQGDFYEDELRYSGHVKFDEEPSTDEDVLKNVYLDNRVDIGAQIGFGVLIKERFIIEARYGRGFTSMMDEDDAMNQAFQFTVGSPLSWGKKK